MEHLIEYFQSIQKCVQEDFSNIENIHIVLGNESCDTDSTISTIALGYFLHVHKPSKISENTVIIPVQNVSKENFSLRTDTCYLLKEIGLPLDILVYRDQISFETLIKTKKVSTSLVDHHVLIESQRMLENTVIQIFDHRPQDPSVSWDQNKVDITLNPVGSCCTLIADHIMCVDSSFLFRELGYLLYATILFDTQSLSPETKKAKDLDIKVVEFLENKFNFPYRRADLYKKIWKIHIDVSTLTPKQILMKDCKVVGNIPVPGLPMLVIDFLQLEGSYDAIRTFSIDNNVPILILVGIDTSESVKRDLAIYFTADGKKFKDTLLDMLCNCQEVKNCNFQLKKIETNFQDIECFRQYNVSLSRKQIIPIILDAVRSQS